MTEPSTDITLAEVCVVACAEIFFRRRRDHGIADGTDGAARGAPGAADDRTGSAHHRRGALIRPTPGHRTVRSDRGLDAVPQGVRRGRVGSSSAW